MSELQLDSGSRSHGYHMDCSSIMFLKMEKKNKQINKINKKKKSEN